MAGEVAFPRGKRRLFIGRTHVREHETAALECLVGALADGLGKGLGLTFLAFGERYLQASTVDVPDKAVITAHDAAFLDDPIFQRCTAVNAVRMQHAHTS